MPSSFANRLKEILSIRGMSAAELARLTNTPESVISQYKNGHYEPKQRRLQTFSEVLNVSIPWLMGADVPMDLPKKAADLISPIKHIKRVPILGRIACGTPILAEENIEGYAYMAEGMRGDFSLTCKGDSMIGAGIYDGDIVFIRQQPEVENGEIAAVLIGEEATLKKVYMTSDTILLIPENPNYDTMTFEKKEMNEVKILGKYIGLTRILD